jgi:O-antigen ligase
MSTVAMAPRAGPDDARRARLLLPVAALGACGAGLVAGKLGASQHPLTVFGLAGLLVPLAIWKWRQAGVFLLLGVATTVEQFTYSAGMHPGVFTSHIPLYGGVTKGGGVSLLDLLIGLVFVFWLMRGVLDRSWEAPRSPVSRGLLALLALVVLAVGIGLSHGGKSQVILYEVRPWFYLSVAYLLAGSLLRTRTALRGVMWVFVIGTGFKALQGVQMYIAVRHDPVPPEAILAHEESFFFGLFLILTLSLWFFGVRGRLRTVATWLAPAVLLADMANARRTAWAIIGTTLIVLVCVTYSSLPEKRPALRRLLLIVAGVSAVYFPLFWSKAGILAQPARSLHSMISPDARDKSSNLYRVQENANLAFNIRKTASLGKGFGPLIDYALPIVDISKSDAFITFLPHNSVLDLWMRLGIQGVVVLLLLLAAVVVRGCALARAGDRELAVLGVLSACAVVAYLVQGYNDMGFFWFRIALFFGIFLGAMEAAHRIVAPRVLGSGPRRCVNPHQERVNADVVD